MNEAWEGRRAEIQRMVDNRMPDRDIGKAFRVTGGTICRIRKLLGIKSRYKKVKKTYEEVFSAVDQSPPLPGESYIDEQGLTVTRYPARYADGALIQSVTARSRR